MRKRKLSALLMPLGLALLLSACSVTFLPDAEAESERPQNNGSSPTRVNPRPRPTPRPVEPDFRLNTNLEYRCSNASMAVRYTSRDSARIYYGDWTELTRTENRDGWFVYSNSEYDWHVKGKEGFLERDGKTVRSDCILQDS